MMTGLQQQLNALERFFDEAFIVSLMKNGWMEYQETEQLLVVYSWKQNRK